MDLSYTIAIDFAIGKKYYGGVGGAGGGAKPRSRMKGPTVQTISIVMVDANGFTSIVKLDLTDVATLAAAVAAVGDGSNADWSEYWGGTTTEQTPAPTAAVFQSGADRAQLMFSTGSGNVTVASIPAPKSAMFLTDGETVDPADPTGAIAALLAILTDSGGSAATAFIGGFRRRLT